MHILHVFTDSFHSVATFSNGDAAKKMFCDAMNNNDTVVAILYIDGVFYNSYRA